MPHMSDANAPSRYPFKTALSLGQVIRARRLELGLTQMQLAERARAQQKWISALERGHGRAELDRVLRVLSALQLNLCAEPADSSLPSALRGRNQP